MINQVGLYYTKLGIPFLTNQSFMEWQFELWSWLSVCRNCGAHVFFCEVYQHNWTVHENPAIIYIYTRTHTYILYNISSCICMHVLYTHITYHYIHIFTRSCTNIVYMNYMCIDLHRISPVIKHEQPHQAASLTVRTRCWTPCMRRSCASARWWFLNSHGAFHHRTHRSSIFIFVQSA